MHFGKSSEQALAELSVLQAELMVLMYWLFKSFSEYGIGHPGWHFP